mmetsp:Transcript_8138/g.23113  ORF Transcript_8138/g.23113 Transcript_8138/m.23113 type:complete len:291 (+) Transcript_8138:815-1687(+)
MDGKRSIGEPHSVSLAHTYKETDRLVMRKGGREGGREGRAQDHRHFSHCPHTAHSHSHIHSLTHTGTAYTPPVHQSIHPPAVASLPACMAALLLDAPPPTHRHNTFKTEHRELHTQISSSRPLCAIVPAVVRTASAFLDWQMYGSQSSAADAAPPPPPQERQSPRHPCHLIHTTHTYKHQTLLPVSLWLVRLAALRRCVSCPSQLSAYRIEGRRLGCSFVGGRQAEETGLVSSPSRSLTKAGTFPSTRSRRRESGCITRQEKESKHCLARWLSTHSQLTPELHRSLSHVM